MRLGAQRMRIFKGTKLWDIYGVEETTERHRHRYEGNYDEFSELFKMPKEQGYKLVISAKSNFVEAIELEEHPFFIGIQYHPELKTKVGKPHPLFKALIDALEEHDQRGM